MRLAPEPAHRAQMTASEILVPPQERADAAAMMQDYVAEMAQFVPDVRAGHAYPYFDFYWSEPDSRWPFWLKLDDANAGFACSRPTDRSKNWCVSGYQADALW